MIHNLKPYPAYKDSGVPWLEKVPEHWEVKRNKLFLREINERSEDGSEELLTVSQYTGVTARRERISEENGLLTNAASLVGYKRVKPGDLVMNIMLAWNGSLGVSPITGIASPAYCVYRVTEKIESRFLHYLFRTPLFTGVFKAVSTGVVDSRLRLYPEVFFRLPSILPPKEEQTAIVRYLDHIDRRIRRYIHAKKKLIKLLEEQKQAIIHQAVTRGLDPNVKFKPSGMEWLGDVPEHWEVLRLKSLVTEAVAGPYGSSLTKAMYTQQGYRVYGQQQVIPDDFTIGDYYISAEQFSQMQRYRVFTDDILVSVMGTVGRVAVVPENAEPGIINPRLVRYRPDTTIVKPRYLQLAMQGLTSQVQLREAAKGTTMEGLNMQILGKLVLAVPPVSEQDSILNEWHTKSEVLVSTENSIRSEISLLREYRTRLIADVVTGKLDVREAAANLPEETDETEVLEDEFAGDEETAEEELESEPEEE
jgi:type I restriction enzyme S subunit